LDANRTTVKPPSSLELPFLRKPPPEVWQLIGSLLTLANAASLAFSFKFIAHTLGTQSWCDLRATEISDVGDIDASNLLEIEEGRISLPLMGGKVHRGNFFRVIDGDD